MTFYVLTQIASCLKGGPRIYVLQYDLSFAVEVYCHRKHLHRVRSSFDLARAYGVAFFYKPMSHKQLKEKTKGSTYALEFSREIHPAMKHLIGEIKLNGISYN